MIEAKITVKGIVQMVGYRYFTMRKAPGLGVKGYVRNLRSGDVEVLAQASSKEKIQELIAVLKEGPSSAVVREVVVEYNTDIEEIYDEFSVSY